MNRRFAYRLALAGFVGILSLSIRDVSAADRKPLNLLFLTVDDMSCDSIGAFGCKLPDTSPNVDRLATQGLRFAYAHVQVANCMPSRNVMYSGRYPHNSGVEGFYQVHDISFPVMADLFKDAGYFTAIRHKVSHSTPYSPYPAWDVNLDTTAQGEKVPSKEVATYGESMRRVIKAARKADKPFFVSMNVADPHKPFYAEGKKGQTVPDKNVPSKEFNPDEVPVPGFLPDDPAIRKELSHYYSSVRRADDCVGGVLEVLRDMGEDERTVIFFLSDHGMPLPFAKTQCYHHSSRTPLIIRWPGVTKPGSLDDKHMVSSVDLLPTICEIFDISPPSQLDGSSFVPLLKGESQSGRDMIVKEYNENSGGNRSPMRAIETKTHLYIFNPWSDGKRVMSTATMGTATYRRMVEMAKTDPAVAKRLDLFQHRVPEEFYDVQNDPDALVNLIDDPTQRKELDHLRSMLEAWMVRTGDPMLEIFRNRDNRELADAYVDRVQQETPGTSRKAKGRKAAAGKKKKAVADE